jgi:hypothetical protein
MSPNLNLVWVNKTRDSSSLSNCRNEKDTFRQIRSQAVIVGHKSSHVKRPIKRTPLNRYETRRYVPLRPNDDLWLHSPGHQRGDSDPLTWFEISQSKNCSRFLNLQRPPGSPLDKDESDNFGNVHEIHPLSGIPDPFSSYSIELDTATLGNLWYFKNIWTQSAFKLPGCVGYGQDPIEQYEITTMIQQCLPDKTRSYCLLAATSARMQYIHNHEGRNDSSGLAHCYAARALRGIRRRLQEHNLFSEEDSTDVLFLAAYEIFCSDELGAEKHLAAVRRFYKQEFLNKFVGRLQVNLEALVQSEDGSAGSWHESIDRLVQSR